MTRRRRARGASQWHRLGWIVAAALVLLALAPVSSAAAGNNGTVKVHEGSSHADPPKTDKNNEPHVCTFHIHGFNFDSDN